MKPYAVKCSSNARKGSILPLAIFLVIFLFLIGLALTRLGLNARLAAAKTTAEIKARAAADAGFEQVVRLMNLRLENKPWNGTPIPAVSDISLPNTNAKFSYDVTNQTGYYQITSTGRSGIAEETVYGRLVLESLLFGIGVKDVIDVKVGVTFTAPSDSRFALRTNSVEDNAVVLKSGVVIPGDVICGPGGDPEDVINIKSSTVITGDSYAASDEIDFPSVVISDDLKTAPLISYSYKPLTPIVGSADPLAPAAIKLDSLSIPNSGIQQIQGHCKIYIVGTTTLSNSAELIVASGASLELYLGGNMEAKNSNGIDNLNAGVPDALKIYGLDSCNKIDLKAKGNVFFGYVYAPEADLNVYAKNEIAGAFVGKSFTLKNSTHFTFIPNTDVGLNDPSAYLIVRWWEE